MATDQRTRILDAALAALAREGAGGTSMRAVAAASGCNVATLYHYFPSKRDLLRAAIAHRRIDELLRHPFPEGLAGSAAERLGALFDHVLREVAAEPDLWRALLSEAIHGDEDVLDPLLETSALFEEALGSWIRELLPDVPGLHDAAVVRAIRHALYGVLVEHLPQPDHRRLFAERARELASVFARMEER